jgi:hypothetical protein
MNKILFFIGITFTVLSPFSVAKTTYNNVLNDSPIWSKKWSDIKKQENIRAKSGNYLMDLYERHGIILLDTISGLRMLRDVYIHETGKSLSARPTKFKKYHVDMVQLTEQMFQINCGQCITQTEKEAFYGPYEQRALDEYLKYQKVNGQGTAEINGKTNSKLVLAHQEYQSYSTKFSKQKQKQVNFEFQGWLSKNVNRIKILPSYLEAAVLTDSFTKWSLDELAKGNELIDFFFNAYTADYISNFRSLTRRLERFGITSKGKIETKIKEMDDLVQSLVMNGVINIVEQVKCGNPPSYNYSKTGDVDTKVHEKHKVINLNTVFNRDYFENLNRYNFLVNNNFEHANDVDIIIRESKAKLKSLKTLSPNRFHLKPSPQKSISLSGLSAPRYAECFDVLGKRCSSSINVYQNNNSLNRPEFIIRMDWDLEEQTEKVKAMSEFKKRPYTRHEYRFNYNKVTCKAPDESIFGLMYQFSRWAFSWKEYDDSVVLNSSFDITQYLYDQNGNLATIKNIFKSLPNITIKNLFSDFRNKKINWDNEINYVNNALNGKSKMNFSKGLGSQSYIYAKQEQGKYFFNALNKYKNYAPFQLRNVESEDPVVVVANFKDGLPDGEFTATWPAIRTRDTIIKKGWFVKGVPFKHAQN